MTDARDDLQISPYAPQLADILATLWSNTQENHFQTSILVTFTKLAEVRPPSISTCIDERRALTRRSTHRHSESSRRAFTPKLARSSSSASTRRRCVRFRLLILAFLES